MSELVSTFTDAVRCRANVPEDEGMSDTRIIGFLEEELEETIYPEVMNWGADFFLTSDLLYLKDTSSNQNYPAGVLPIPTRAFGRTIQDLKLVDKTQLENGIYAKRNVPLIASEDEDLFERSYTTDWDGGSGNGSFGFFLVNDGIRITGNMQDEDEIVELRYVYRPPAVEASSTLHGDVNSLNYASSTAAIGVSSVGTDLNTYCGDTETKLFDIWRKSSGTLMFLDVKMTRSGTTFSTTDLNAADIVQMASFQKGGFTDSGNVLNSAYSSEIMIVPAERANYVPVHDALYNLVVLATVARVLEAQGDTEMMQVTLARYRATAEKLRKVHTPRVKGEPKKIVNRRGIAASLSSGYFRG